MSRVGFQTVLCLLGGAFLFGSAIGWEILWANAAIWRLPPADLPMMLTGVEALLREPWRFPLTNVNALSFGPATSIVYRDSIPAAAILAKALGVGGIVNPLGAALAVNYLFQPAAALAMLVALGVKRGEMLFVGVCIACLLPAWPARAQMTHFALTAHWLILLALALAFRATRRPSSPWLSVAVVCLPSIALAVHGYLFAMTAPLALAGCVGVDPSSGDRLKGFGARLAAMIALCGITAWLLGYGDVASPGGFGIYSMNLLSPVWPERSALADWLLNATPAFPALDGTGGQYEGFNFLGFGALGLMALAAASIVGERHKETMNMNWLLCAALSGMFAFSLSHHVFFGRTMLVAAPLPDWLLQALGQLRASGRFFWPVAYALIGLSILRLSRSPHRRPIAIVALALLGIQATDGIALHRDAGASLAIRVTPALDAGPWRAAVVGRDVAVFPSYNCLPLETPLARVAINQISLATVRGGGRIMGAMEARANESCEANLAAALEPATSPGRVNFVFVDAMPNHLLRRIASQQICGGFQMGLACGAAATIEAFAAVDGNRFDPPQLAVGARRAVTDADPSAPRLLGTGWRALSQNGVWSSAKESDLAFRLPSSSRSDAVIELDLTIYAPSKQPSQRVVVLVGKHRIAEQTFDASHTSPLRIAIPADAVDSKGEVNVTLSLPDAISPSAAGDWIDPTPLAILLRALTLLPPNS